MNSTYDVAVVGGGSGGVGTAIAAGRAGLNVLLVEQADTLGGTSTRGGVNCWEMMCGGTGIPFDIYRELKTIPKAVGFYRTNRHICWEESGFYPGGEALIDPSLHYKDSLLRQAAGAQMLHTHKEWTKDHWHGMIFEPTAMSNTMLTLLKDAGVTVLLNTAFVKATASANRVDSVELSNGDSVRATAFVDSTANADMCINCGCEYWFGEDPKSRFGESAAPEESIGRLNGVTLMFRVGRKSTAAIDPLPNDVPDKCWWQESFPMAAVNQYPCGDLSLNPLPIMEGKLFGELGNDEAYDECQRRTLAFWHHWQMEFPEWQEFVIISFSSVLGVREGRRVAGEYVLKQEDMEAGVAHQAHDDIIAITDHPMDVHGSHGPHCTGVASAYGVPYRCLIPKGFRNLLIASRGASFSSLAASGCRLSRAMIQLGQAAGTAVALAKELSCDVPDVPALELRRRLLDQHVQLEWPLTRELQEYLGDQ